jgi:AcrR family transcriptional regulator
MYSDGMTETGLRERSKARRRAAITRAAYELFAERGYDATTVADIAEAAEVSPRTIAMYFPAKQDIAMSRVDDAVASLNAAMDSRQPGETVTDVLGRWLLATQTEPQDLEQRMLARRMFAANPQLAALRTARLADVMRGGAAVIAADARSEPGAIGPRLAAAAISAMIAEILDAEPGAAREEAIAAAKRFIEAGIAAL